MSTKRLLQGWRWYGPNDPVSLQDVKQAGASVIVNALHHIPHGEVWPLEAILERKAYIEKAGLTWGVVESLPVHEVIKTRARGYEQYIKNYKASLVNLAKAGVKTVCYNFMPVLDWTRTQLDYTLENGAKALYFNFIDLAIFDIYVLKRSGAENDYPREVLDQAAEKAKGLSSSELDELANVVLMGIPNEKNIELEDLRKNIDVYKNIDKEGLRENLKLFLEDIAQVCQEHGIKMTIHPDDPPYAILGLPRIAGNMEDFKYILDAVDQPFNGICFCTGSLSAGKDNDIPALLEEVKERVYFAHLRAVKKDDMGNFYEADHLDGDVDMYRVVEILSKENQNRSESIVFRPDHGHQLLDDLHKVSNPGYSAIGRLKGLAEIRGLELGVIRNANPS